MATDITKSFEIGIADLDLHFRTVHLDDPRPTGRQVILAAGHKPADEFIVLQWLKNGDLEEVDLDKPVDIHERGVERFIVSKSDRTFRLELEGQREEWPAQFINGKTLKNLAKKDASEFDVFLERQDEPDREIADDELVDLAQEGVEKFRFRKAKKEVEIEVNEKRVTITRGKHTGLEIKEAAIDQKVNIKLDFILTLEIAEGKYKTIGDDDKVTVKAGQKYTAVAEDDKS